MKSFLRSAGPGFMPLSSRIPSTASTGEARLKTCGITFCLSESSWRECEGVCLSKELISSARNVCLGRAGGLCTTMASELNEGGSEDRRGVGGRLESIWDTVLMSLEDDSLGSAFLCRTGAFILAMSQGLRGGNFSAS